MPTVPELLAPQAGNATDTETSRPTMLADQAAQTRDRQRGEFVSTLETVSKVNPDHFAEATQLERLSGIPADVLHQHRDQMNALMQGNKYAGVYDQYRRTAEALANGKTAAIAQDDIDNLTRIENAKQVSRFDDQSAGEKIWGSISQAFKSQDQGEAVSYADRLERLKGTFDQVDQEVTRAALANELPYGGKPGLTGFASDYLGMTPEDRAAMRERLLGRQAGAISEATGLQDELDAAPIEPGAIRNQELGGDTSAMATAIAQNPGYAFRSAIGSASTMGPMLVAGAIGGPLAAGVVEFGVESDAKLLDVLREAKVDLGNPKAILTALQDDALMTDARRRAALKAAGTTAVDVIGMGLAGKLLVPSKIGGKALTNTQQELANIVAQVPVQAVTGGASEAAGQFLADGKVNGGDVLMEAVAGAASAPLDVAVFGGTRILESVSKGLEQSRQAREGQATINEMVDASLNSKTRGRDAETFASVAENQLKDSQFETISIPAAALNSLNQDGAPPVLGDLMKRVPGMTEQYAEAEARGGSVILKTSDYLAYFAEYHDQLSGSVRTNIEGMSIDESKAWQEAQEEQIEQLADSLAQPPSAYDDAFIGLMSELQQAGYRRADAEQYASVHLSALSTLASRTGKALPELMARFPLDIRNKAPESLQSVPVDDMRIAIGRLRSGDIPQSRDMFGKSLVEYLRDAGGLNDAGGELDALDVNFGKVGRNRLAKKEGGLSLDEAAMRAWENGYFPGVAREDVNPQMIIDAAQRDMNDQPTFSSEQENATLRDQAANLQNLQDYLDQLGVNLNELSDDQVLAILRDPESVEGVQLDQAGIDSVERLDDSVSEDARYLISELLDNGATVFADGKVRLYHRSTDAAVKAIRSSGKMKGAEDGLFFSTKQDGEATGFGDNMLTFDIPADQLLLDDAFGDEAHVRIPTEKRGQLVDVSQWLEKELNQTGNEKQPRGFITFNNAKKGEQRKFQITVTGRRDLSTLLHEFGHFYLEVVNDLASDSDAPQQIKDDLAAIREWVGANPNGDGIGSYVTAKGSKYSVHADGTTSRNKKARNDVGHEGDSGAKKRSARTVYVDTNAAVLSAAGLKGLGPNGARLAIKNGKATLLTWNDLENRWGTTPGARDITVSDTPAVGLYPLEMWSPTSDVPGYESFSNMHAGNKIISVEAKSIGGKFTVDQHEQFARGFEAYLAEGKAPNPELAGAFARFKRWIIAVYKDLRRLNVELTDEIRAVMDRIVATDEQIRNAEQVSQAMPLFEDAAKAGMTEKEFQAYRNQIELAHDEAATTIEQQIIREEERRQSKWWSEQSAKVAIEVDEELQTLPEYAAIRALRTGVMPDGTQQKIKLNTAQIKEQYGTAVLRKLAFMHEKGGMDMDVAAVVLNFTSGDELVKGILGAPSRAETIKTETAIRMNERYGARSTGEAAERAMDAVHNEKRGAVLLKELHALGKQGNRSNITSQQVLKMAAERIMQNRKVRDIQPFEYQRAEATAGRKAFDSAAKGDLAAAYQAKQQQLLNFYLWREAFKARQSVESIVDRMAKNNKTSTRERLGKAGHDYLDQVDAVMEQYEFRNVSLRDIDKRVSFAKWYTDQLALGNEPDVPEFVLNNSQRTNYKELSLAQLQELDEFVQNVKHLAGLKNKLLANSRLRDFKEATDLMSASAYGNLEKRRPLPIDKSTMSAAANFGQGFGNMSSSLLKMEQIVEWLDGGDVDGPWHNAFWQPFVEAQAQENDINRELTTKLMANIEAHQAANGRKALREQFYIKSINQTFSKNAILATALNVGNAGNRAKLLKGHAWEEHQLAEILGYMNKADWDFVQGQWDLVESLWPQIEQLEKDLHGVAPEKVQATPVQTPYGEVSGGYWPLVYDVTSPAYANVANTLSDGTGLFEEGYGRATTPRGHTKARVDGFAAPLMLDTGIIANHLGQVVHDLTHRRPIMDAAKIIGNSGIKQTLIDTLGPNIANQFNPWLRGVANDRTMDSQKGLSWWSKALQQGSANLSIAWMGFSVTTGIQQILGYSQAMEHLAQTGGRRFILKGMKEFATHPMDTMKWVKAVSGEMRNRDANLDNNIREALRKSAGKNGAHAVMQRLAFKHIALIQSVVDYPTWLAGYHQAIDAGESHDVAVRTGDRAVRLSQMAAGPKDLSAVQRNSFMKPFTIVYSYFNLLYNRQADLVHSMKTAKGVQDYLNAFERTMYLIVLPSMMAPLLVGNGPGEDDSYAEWAALKIATYPLMGVPFVRDAASALESGWAYSGATPVGEVFKSVTRLAKSVTQDEVDAEQVTLATMDAVGMSVGVPTAQPKRIVKYLFGVADGTAPSEDIVDWMKGLMFGPPKEPK